MKGLDVMVRKRFGPHLDSWITYAYGSVEYQFDQLNDFQAFPADHEQLHTFTWTQLANLGKWSVSGNLTYGSGRPFTEAQGILAIPRPNPNATPDYEIDFGPRNEARLPDYFRMDLSAHYNFTLQNRISGRFGLSILNITNQFNVGQRRYIALPPSTASGRSEAEVFQYDRELLGRTPNIFLKLTW